MDENTKEIDLKEIEKAIQENPIEEEYEEYDDYDEPPSKFEKVALGIGVIIIIGVLCAILYGGYVVYNMFSQERDFDPSAVPDFVGKNYSEVIDYFSDPKFKKVELNKKVEYKEDVDEDIVISQKYERRDLKDQMFFTVSGGFDPDEEISLPNFKIMERDEIEKFLEENHITKYEFKEMVFQSKKPGSLVSYTPEKETLKRNERITFVFAKKLSKEGNMFLPSFEGMSKEQIEKWGQDNDIQIEIKEEVSEDVEKGHLIKQSPTADTEVEPKSKVTVVLSKGDLVQFGTVNGKALSTVKQSFEIEEFPYEVVTVYDYRTKKDVVVRSEPEGNLELERGTKITLYVSGGKPVLSDLVGKTRNEAQNIIYQMKNNGAKFTENFTEEYNNAEQGTVLSISNTSEIPENGSVTIKISKGPQVFAQNFSGKSKAEIESFATTNGINISSSYRYSNLPENTVISNSPSKGVIEKGSSMSVVYSLGQFSPRDYSGSQYSDVEREINDYKAQGADIVLMRENVSDDSVSAGRVISQSFNSGILTVRVSTGEDTSYYTVEDLVGIPVDAARNTQTCRLFNCVFKKEEGSQGNIVLSQDIIGEYRKGTTINLTY